MYKRYLEELYSQLALDFNCTAGDFSRKENILTVSAANKGRRWYSPEREFLMMATFGGNTVITADERLHGFLSGYIKEAPGYYLFSVGNLFRLNAELEKYGYRIKRTHHMFLLSSCPKAEYSFPVRWYLDREIDRFYGDERFHNAICDRYIPERPDRIAVTGLDGEGITGMAGCSEDAPRWQQIGIDVLPAYRSRGIGKELVKLIRDKILERGDIPFYGTDLGNYHSQNIALACGFRPTWVELNAERADV
ncbi:MAG: GNAT family N-acetyltransferase [Ruminococcus sp.]|nr:GNAT family N-acetyltransferase [Ruminococcus sp.]